MNPMNRIQSLNQHLYLHLNHHSTAFNLIHAFPFLDIPGADIPTGKDLSALDVDQRDWDYVDELLEEMEKNSFEYDIMMDISTKPSASLLVNQHLLLQPPAMQVVQPPPMMSELEYFVRNKNDVLQ